MTPTKSIAQFPEVHERIKKIKIYQNKKLRHSEESGRGNNIPKEKFNEEVKEIAFYQIYEHD